MTPGSQRIRIVHAVQNLNYGGMERMLAGLITHFDPDRFECHLMTLQYLGRFTEGLEPFATFHEVPQQSRWSMLWPTEVTRSLLAIRPDVVHTHSGVWYKVSLAARRAGVRWVVHTDHGRPKPDRRTDRLLDRIAANRTDVVIAVSNVLAGDLRNGIVRRKTSLEVIPNGVDTIVFARRKSGSAIRSELGIDAQAPIVASIGRLEVIKGYDVLIRAFAYVLKEWPSDRPRPVLVMAGDGAERADLENLAGGLRLGDQVHFLGWRDDVEDLYSELDVFAMGSRSEGTSVSLLEAMSCQNCPAVTDVGGNRAVLGPDLAHRLAPSEDPAALGRILLDALTDDAARQRDAVRARARVESTFNLRSTVQAYEHVYTRLTS